jgi:glycosyltransferase involved in cell wall biosynthesis
MNIIQITPGAGGMYCGGCFRDNALVAALRQQGHNTAMVPLYLPMTLDEEDQSEGTPIFFGGINVYLEQKSPLFAKLPHWAHRLLDSPALLNWVGGSAAKTRPSELGDLTLSMLQGEHGRQVREIEELVTWLRDHFHPDVICLSNALLLGMVRRLKEELKAPVFCLLGGEDAFVDSLPASHRQATWQTLVERARDVDCFVAPSEYFAQLMRSRLNVSADRMAVVPVGVNLTGYGPDSQWPDPPVLGYFARMCREKGLPTLIDAFVHLKERGRIPGLRLKIGGGLSPVDAKQLVNGLRELLQKRGHLDAVEFCPNLTREEKLEFFRSLSLFSVPALYGEAFGLYLIEAWASGVPVVQPRHAAFPELIEATQAGVLCEPGDPAALADAIESLLLQPARLRSMGQAGRKAAVEQYGIERMAAGMVTVFQQRSSQGHLQGVAELQPSS